MAVVTGDKARPGLPSALAGCVRYARVTPGVAAGTVTVALEADGAGGTRAQVTYDLTSL